MAAIKTETEKTVGKMLVKTLSSATIDETLTASTAFELPLSCSAVTLVVSASDTTKQVVYIQGSIDGTTFMNITGATLETAIDGTSKCAVFSRNTGTGMIGFFPYYRIANTTASKPITASIAFTRA